MSPVDTIPEPYRTRAHQIKESLAVEGIDVSDDVLLRAYREHVDTETPDKISRAVKDARKRCSAAAPEQHFEILRKELDQALGRTR